MNRSSGEEAAIQELFEKHTGVPPNQLTTLDGSVSDTAYLVCESRARRVDISEDSYAHHWIAPDHRESVSDLWDEFSRAVYSYDDLEVSLRNRYWLEQINKFVRSTEDPVFVNIGGGLTSYPFLLDRPVPSHEFDRPAVVVYKNARMEELKQQDVIPPRDVSYYPVDLDSKEDLKRLKIILGQRCASRSSFNLCEGLMYYLEWSTVNAMIDIFRDVQQEDSVLGIDYWKPGVAESPVFLKMKAFFSERFGLKSSGYTFIDNEWISNIEGYETEDQSTVVEQESIYAGTQHLQDHANVLLESYATLKRS